MSKAYTLASFRVFEEDARGRWHWTVEDAGDDCGVILGYHEDGRDPSLDAPLHLAMGPDGLRKLAAALVEIADRQERGTDD